MAKLRQNHSKQGNSGNSFMSRAIIFTGLLIGVIFFGTPYINDMFSDDRIHDSKHNPSQSDQQVEINYHRSEEKLPSVSGTNRLVRHHYYTLSYNEDNELAEWVAYPLTRASIALPNVKRAKRFNEDPNIPSRSAAHSDYSHSGYTRGHLAPAGDMAFNDQAMNESFYMSNMAPQIRPFNNGVWKELEETVRDWAYRRGEVYVVSGPILTDISDRIGKNKVGVPKSFFKIVQDENEAIAFVIPHEKTDLRLQKFATTIDDVERITGIDFFEAMEDTEEDRLESNININKWDFDNKRYRLRVEKWNHE